MKNYHVSISTLFLIATAITTGCDKNIDGAANARAESTSQPRFDTLVIPNGTSVLVALDAPISTDVNSAGDTFTATTLEPIIVDSRTAVPAGAKIHGVLYDVQASGRVTGRARMTLEYETLVDSQGQHRTITAVPLTLQAASATQTDVGIIAAGGVLGAIVGGIAGGGKGAAIGAGAGAGAGAIIMLATKGDDLELNAGQRLSVHLTGPTDVEVAR